MDNREITQLWNVDTDHKPLRRPNTVMNVDIADRTTDSITKAPTDGDFSILNTSSLRVEAKEWFPSSYIPPQQQQETVHSVQDRLQKFKISDGNSKTKHEPSYDIPQAVFDPSKLKSILQALTYDPGQFDNLCDQFMYNLSPYFEDMDAAHKVADMIFELAVNEACFRYNGARLCAIIDEPCPFFRSRLHSLCERELQQSQNPRGLTLFLAELYMQLNYENIYGQSLLKSVMNLLKLGKLDDIKCVCQTLKLTGYSLESRHSNNLDEIFKELELLKPTFNQTLSMIYESTINLRRTQWGRGSTTIDADNSDGQNGCNTGPSDSEIILYGPDGQEISAEEQELLDPNCDEYYADESSDPDDLFEPEPEMDPEIQEAFREFVKMSKR